MLARAEFLSEKYEAAITNLTKIVDILSEQKNTNYYFEARLLRARIYLVQQENLAAKEELKLLEGMQPKHPMVNYMLGVLAYVDEDMNLASSYIYKSLNTDPTFGPGLYLLGVIKYMQKLPSQSLEYLTKYLRQYDDPLAQELLTRIKIKKGDVNDISDFGGSFDEESISPNTLRLLSFEAFKRGDDEKGQLFLSKSIEKSEGARAEIIKSAVIYNLKNNTKEAIKLLEALPISEQPPYTREQLLVEYYLKESEVNAIGDLQESILSSNIDPDQKHVIQGDINLRLNKYKQAKKDYLQALNIKPGSILVLLRLARLESIFGDFDSAHDYLDNIEKINPERIESKLLRANLFVNSNLNQEAVSLLNEYVQAKKLTANEYAVITRYLFENKLINEAEKIADQGYSAYPNSQITLSEVARLKLQLKKIYKRTKICLKIGRTGAW